MSELKETVRDFIVGLAVVGTTAVKLIPIPVSGGGIKGVILKAPSSNTGVVYIGRSNVTADQDVGTGGFPLEAGTSVTLPVEDVDQWFAVSTAASQVVNWINL